MRWFWFFPLITIAFIIMIAVDKPYVASYQVVELEYDKVTNAYFAVINGQEIDVVGFDRADTTEMCAGMSIYCLQASKSRLIRCQEYFFSPTDIDPNEWVKDIYCDAGEAKGAIFLLFLLFLILLMCLCLMPKEMTIIHADND